MLLILEKRFPCLLYFASIGSLTNMKVKVRVVSEVGVGNDACVSGKEVNASKQHMVCVCLLGLWIWKL